MQEENSSSQKDSIFIKKINFNKADNNIVKVELSFPFGESNSIFFVSFDFYYEKNLFVDMEIDETLFEEISFQNDFSVCKIKSLKLLANREHSVLELRQKLYQKKISDKNVVNLVVNELLEKNYLNDERFATMYINYLIKQNKFSRNMVLSKLYQKGIDKKNSKKLLEELYSFEDEETLAEKFFSREIEYGKTLEKIISSLKMKGFNFSTIMRLVNKYKN